MIWHHDSSSSFQDWASARRREETRWDEKELKMKTEMRQELMKMHFNVMKHRWDGNRSESHLSQIWARCLKSKTRRDAF